MPGGPRPRRRLPCAHADHRPIAPTALPMPLRCPRPDASPNQAKAAPAAVQHMTMPLFSPMAESHPLTALRVQTHVHRRDGTDKPVDQRLMPSCAHATYAPAKAAISNPTQTKQGLQRVIQNARRETPAPINHRALWLTPTASSPVPGPVSATPYTPAGRSCTGRGDICNTHLPPQTLRCLARVPARRCRARVLYALRP